MTKRVLLCLSMVMAVGCATTDDPRQGGLFSYSPTAYERRLEQRRQNLTALQQNQREEEERSQQLESGIQTRQALLDQERERIRLLDAELARLQQHINQRQTQTAAQKAEKQRLRQELKRLQAQVSALGHESPLAQAEKESKIDSIKREIDELSKLASQLAR